MKKTTLLLAAAWMLLLLFVPISMHATSPARIVDIYQTNTSNVTQILYDYPDTITGNDNLKYGLVDMGTSVLWADRNVGANRTNEIGGYFKWGIPTDLTGSVPSSSDGHDVSNATSVYILSELEDAATCNIGASWSMPTSSQWNELLDNTTLSNNIFYNKTDNTKTLTFPASPNGYSLSNSWTWQNSRVYWCKDSYYRPNYSSDPSINVFTDNGGNYSVKYLDGSYTFYSSYAMNIRGVYNPANTFTLTIIVDKAVYTYICESGQNITVAIHPDEANSYAFKRWNDGNTNSTRTFIVTEDATYYAICALTNINVYENVSTNTTTILYDLSAQIGKDGIIYKPIDLGFGVAWADKMIKISVRQPQQKQVHIFIMETLVGMQSLDLPNKLMRPK